VAAGDLAPGGGEEERVPDLAVLVAAEEGAADEGAVAAGE
jgi:hypothetical protein